ncbi:hypothetical protein [Bacteroides sp. 51]|uniref:hypothetical protein n=1 Tax=Bacteroides sp. 51 TaxID=2302938 RepID=UPI0013D1687E|nr:hypothetical protein [Bacteroides sp. 51]NDV84850.1 hypothetical protein [Bacteroides sp. 51]
MKENTSKSENQPRTLDNNPKASNQAPLGVILQQYKERNIQRYAGEEDEELIQENLESAPSESKESILREKKTNNTRLLSTDVAQLALISVNPQSGPVRLDAERFNGPDLYMWNQDQRTGEDPSNTIGFTDLFTNWAGAQLVPTATFHRAHAYGKQFGGAGNESNVAWWAGAAEDQWTPFEDRIRGDNNGGNALNWEPGEGESGNYNVTRTLHPLEIRVRFRNRLISACNWGLRNNSTSFLALLPTLATDMQREEADRARITALAQVNTAIDDLLNQINIDNAERLIILSMTINYTRTNVGINPGNSRNDVNNTVHNPLTIDNFGLVDNDQQVWNALSTFGGMFGKGRQQLSSKLNVRLTAPIISNIEKARLEDEATQELTVQGQPAPAPKDIKIKYGEKLRNWRALNPQIVLGPIIDGWGRI